MFDSHGGRSEAGWWDQIDYIDLHYQHRVDPEVPIENVAAVDLELTAADLEAITAAISGVRAQALRDAVRATGNLPG